MVAGVERDHGPALGPKLDLPCPGPGSQREKTMASDKRESPHRGNSYIDLSEKDLDTIRGSYAALNAGDVQGALAALHRDAVWRESRELPGGDEFDGRAAIEEFLEGFLEQWDAFHQHVESTLCRGDRILVNIRMEGVGRESGAEVNARYAHLWTLRDGLGARVDAFYDSETALRELEA